MWSSGDQVRITVDRWSQLQAVDVNHPDLGLDEVTKLSAETKLRLIEGSVLSTPEIFKVVRHGFPAGDGKRTFSLNV